MDTQGKFDTVLYLFREKLNITQKEVCQYLQKNGFPKTNETMLSKAKSTVNQEGLKISGGEYGAGRLQAWLEVLENWLIAFDIYPADDHSHYYHRTSGNKFPHIYQGKQKIKTRDGIVESYRTIPRELLWKKIQQGGEIRLLQTFMSTAETYAESFKRCLQRGGRIKLLLMNPRGMAAKIRTRSFPDQSVDVESMINQNLRILQQLPHAPGQLDIRFYDEFPGIEMFGFEDRIFYGFYLHKKFAKDGYFFELLNHKSFQLARDLNSNWEEIWREAVPVGDIEEKWEGKDIDQFLCHSIQAGSYHTFEMKVNRLTLDVLLQGMPGSENFRGTMDMDNDRVISIQASTSNRIENGKLVPIKKRTASLLIYNSSQGLWLQELSSGVFINYTPEGVLQSNLILIENIKRRTATSGKSKRDRYLDYIELYLDKQELKADEIPAYTLYGLKSLLKQRDNRRLNQHRLLPLLAGQFQLFYPGIDEKRQPMICRRPLVISKEKKRAKREIWDENRTKIFSILMPDTHNIMLHHLNREIADSEFIFLRRVGMSWNHFQGQMIKVSDKIELKIEPCYMMRTEDLPNQLEYHIPYQSEGHQKLSQFGQFSTVFPLQISV